MKLIGTGVSPGVAYAKIKKLEIQHQLLNITGNLESILDSLDNVSIYLESQSRLVSDEVMQGILEAQSMMANDPDLKSEFINNWENYKSKNTLNELIEVVFDQFKKKLENIGGYFAERVEDINGINNLLKLNIMGEEFPEFELNEDCIVVAADLTPSDTSTMNLSYVKGLVIENGGPTSHTAIVARNLGIPAIVGCSDARNLKEDDLVLINGREGFLVKEPDFDFVESEKARESELINRYKRISGPGKLQDNTIIQLLANCGNIVDAKKAIINEAEGIGLFRTELLYLNQITAPSISEQVKVYSEIFEIFQGKKVIIRTLDAGSDKPVPFLNSVKEENPALGVRGWRLIREFHSVIKDQIKAISIAQESGKCDVWVMAPMIDTADEALEFSNLAKENGIKKIGVMIETPSAAMVSDQIFEIVDFASFGTNDLTQYVMAADRLDSRLSDLTNSWHPAVLRTIEIVGKNAQGKPLGVCGEAAADPLLAAVLIGLGVNSLSMASNSITEVKSFIANQDLGKCQNIAKEILKTKNAFEAKELAVKLFN